MHTHVYVLANTLLPWPPGEKLSESNASDVRALCSTLLNTYLIQLLDTGFLHAGARRGGRREAGAGAPRVAVGQLPLSPLHTFNTRTRTDTRMRSHAPAHTMLTSTLAT